MHGPLRLRDYDGLIRTGFIYIGSYRDYGKENGNYRDYRDSIR